MTGYANTLFWMLAYISKINIQAPNSEALLNAHLSSWGCSNPFTVDSLVSPDAVCIPGDFFSVRDSLFLIFLYFTHFFLTQSEKIRILI